MKAGGTGPWRPVWLLLLVFSGIALSGCVNVVEIKGDSMEPTLKNGQRVTVDRNAFTQEEPRRGDVVLFEHGGVSRISRVVGLPGEAVRIAEGSVYVDGSRLDEPYLAEGTRTESGTERFQVPEASYFLMGDNREHSNDSRAIGPIPRTQVVGKIR